MRFDLNALCKNRYSFSKDGGTQDWLFRGGWVDGDWGPLNGKLLAGPLFATPVAVMDSVGLGSPARVRLRARASVVVCVVKEYALHHVGFPHCLNHDFSTKRFLEEMATLAPFFF